MVRATKAEEAKAEEAPDAAAAETATPAAAPEAKSADLEDRIASQIAEATVDEDREKSVSGAVSRYGIARELAEEIHDIATEAGIDPAMAFGLVKTESTFDPRAVSGVGARGLTQVMPRTARWLMPGTKAEDLYDRQTNLRLGFRYLSQLIDKYRGDVRLALTAYNRGPGTVDRVLKRGGNPDNGYADKVLGG
jgi:soluble lytic murein transglycosylase-like protein